MSGSRRPRRTPSEPYSVGITHGFDPDQASELGAPRSPTVLVVLVLVEVLGTVVAAPLLAGVADAVVARQLSLQGLEIGGGGAVLELPRYLCLLGLGSAAPHGSTPLHAGTGRPGESAASFISTTSSRSHRTGLGGLDATRPQPPTECPEKYDQGVSRAPAQALVVTCARLPPTRPGVGCPREKESA